MKSKFLFSSVLFILMINFTSAQVKDTSPKIIIDEKSNKPMLIGFCSRDNLLSDTSFSWWFEAEYEAYDLEDSVIKLIKLDSIKIVCVMGTWCSDSRREVPHLFKILDALKFDYKNFEMFCVDRKKQAEGFDIDQFVIEKVPTFIFYKNDSEIGRIIESPVETLERDILKILNFPY